MVEQLEQQKFPVNAVQNVSSFEELLVGNEREDLETFNPSLTHQNLLNILPPAQENSLISSEKSFFMGQPQEVQALQVGSSNSDLGFSAPAGEITLREEPTVEKRDSDKFLVPSLRKRSKLDPVSGNQTKAQTLLSRLMKAVEKSREPEQSQLFDFERKSTNLSTSSNFAPFQIDRNLEQNQNSSISGNLQHFRDFQKLENFGTFSDVSLPELLVQSMPVHPVQSTAELALQSQWLSNNCPFVSSHLGSQLLAFSEAIVTNESVSFPPIFLGFCMGF